MPIYPPGQNGLAGEIQALKQQIAELSRRPDNVPNCVVRVTATANMPNDMYAFFAGSMVPLSDKWGMFHSDANFSYIQMPIAGYYSVQMHVSWFNNQTGIRSAIITKNYTAVDTSGGVIARDDRNALGTGLDLTGTTNHAIVETETFAAGDKVYFAVYQNSGNVLQMHTMSEAGRTAVSARYLGPA